jgi:ABC-type multidrug transport system fused ATPase/permease subunit
LTEDNITQWRNLVGYVPQNIYLADKSIAENIAFGVPKIDIDLKRVEFVANKHKLMILFKINCLQVIILLLGSVVLCFQVDNGNV